MAQSFHGHRIQAGRRDGGCRLCPLGCDPGLCADFPAMRTTNKIIYLEAPAKIRLQKTGTAVARPGGSCPCLSLPFSVLPGCHAGLLPEFFRVAAGTGKSHRMGDLRDAAGLLPQHTHGDSQTVPEQIFADGHPKGTVKHTLSGFNGLWLILRYFLLI